jgi:ferredoxin-NADP reductase
VGIKRVDGGAFSTFANEELAVGDTLQVMPPTGRFTVDLDPEAAHNYLAFAGGSGITPVLSLIRSVLAGSRSRASRSSTPTAGEHDHVPGGDRGPQEPPHGPACSVIHVLEQDAQEIELFTGRVTEEKCADLFRDWIDVGAMDMAFICGPEPMMQGIARALEAHGMAKDRIRTSFSPPPRSRVACRSARGRRRRPRARRSAFRHARRRDAHSRCRPIRPCWRPRSPMISTCRSPAARGSVRPAAAR